MRHDARELLIREQVEGKALFYKGTLVIGEGEISALKMETACFTETLCLPTSPRGVSTAQKKNVDIFAAVRTFLHLTRGLLGL